MILPISKLPAAVLRAQVNSMNFPLDKQMRRLVLDMLETVQSADGIGLAATQVGKSLDLALIFLVSDGKEPFFICNPKIIDSSEEQVEIEEGCLSMPGVYGMVKRPKQVTVEYTGLDGKTYSITDDSWTARVLQHEIDHLHGTLIIDKFSKVTKGEELLEQYR